VAIISADQDILTVIVVFTVDAEHSQELVDLLVRTTQEVTSRHAGYISTSLHVNPPRTRVTNYSQWRSREDFDAMLDDPAGEAGRQAIRRLAAPDAAHYKVVWSHSADGP
jgi:quinol monooxygenase YgiN